MAGDSSIIIWDVATGAELRAVDSGESLLEELAFSPDGSLLAAGAHHVAVWDPATGTKGRDFGSDLTFAAFTPDGTRLLATTSADERLSGARDDLSIWDVATGDELGRLTGHTESITGAAFTADGSLLATSSFDATVRLWTLDSARRCGFCAGPTGGCSAWQSRQTVAWRREGR